MAESEEELKCLLMKVKETSEKLASSPIMSWKIDGDTVQTVRNFIFWGSKVTADDDCNHEIKRHLFPSRKTMINLDSILKNRDTTLPTRVCLVKGIDFLVAIYGYEELNYKESCALKN